MEICTETKYGMAIQRGKLKLINISTIHDSVKFNPLGVEIGTESNSSVDTPKRCSQTHKGAYPSPCPSPDIFKNGELLLLT